MSPDGQSKILEGGKLSPIPTERQDTLMPPDPNVRIGLGLIARTFLGIGFASFSLAALGEAREWMTNKRRWFTNDEYMQGLGLAQLMPGAPTVNLTSYLGYRLRGLPGAAVATICFLTPCFLLMLLLSHLYLKYGEMPVVSGLFRGLGALVVGLVLNTILNLLRSGTKTIFKGLMAFAGFAMVFWFKMGVTRILLIAGSTSLVMVLLTHRFSALATWTGSWNELWKKGTVSAGEAIGQSGPQQVTSDKVKKTKGRCTAPIDDPDYVSACSRLPLCLQWRKSIVLVICLSLFLAVDLLLINLRPELMQMGSRFLRIGALVFGSGYAMLPFIQDTVVNRFNWLTDQQFAVALALSLITPGPVTIIGTFIGYKVAGVIGALVGTVNMYFPAWAMTAMVADPYTQAGRVGYVKEVLGGIVAAFIGTLVVVLIKLAGDTLVDIPAISMAAAAFLLRRFAKIETVWIVLGGALVSLVLFR
ncbi:Chromate transporter, chromate ion transporter family [Syntrophobacter sp. SbD1]|nr:Chromate transporter, chromate ion transporter family [Syntrophobacter sp. SbD1]